MSLLDFGVGDQYGHFQIQYLDFTGGSDVLTDIFVERAPYRSQCTGNQHAQQHDRGFARDGRQSGHGGVVDDTHAALRVGLHDVQFLLSVQQPDASGLVGGYITCQADNFLLGVG